MAQPLPARKQAVDLAGGPRKVGSRIRRAPPSPPEKTLSAADIREREAWVMGIGITAIALAVMVLLFAAAQWAGWTPANYIISVK